MAKLYDDNKKNIALLNNLEIPKLSDKELLELYKRIKPIVSLGEIKYLLRNYSINEIKRNSYIWSINKDVRESIDNNKLEQVDDFYCLHTWAFYGLFKPTIGEVLSQIPSNLIDKTNTFEIVEYPETIKDIHKYNNIYNSGYHLSKVRTYKLHK